MTVRTIRISFSDLAAPGESRRSLTELEADDHIHGDLLIEVQGRRLPHLGYFGPNDVCFADWLEQLAAVRAAFLAADPARHVFDEGEQGQPAFVFEREGASGYITIADSELTSSFGRADPGWQRVPFSSAELVDEIQRFRQAFLDHVRSIAPGLAEQWMAVHGIAP